MSLRIWWQRLKSLISYFKQQTLIVYFVAREPQTPVLPRLLALLFAAYALSPIDLIPDFIPVIGYLDDLIVVPLGFALVLRFTPEKIKSLARARALRVSEKPTSRVAAVLIVFVWMILLLLSVYWIFF